MKGQWFGKYKAEQNGHPDREGDVVLNVDERENAYRGQAALLPSDGGVPALSIGFATSNKDSPFDVTTENIAPIDPKTLFISTWDDLKDVYPGIALAKSVRITGTFSDTQLDVVGVNSLDVKFRATLTKDKFSSESSVSGLPMTWSEFRAEALKSSRSRLVFRGQRKPWKLRTGFHRRQRYVINDYTTQDVNALARYFSAKTQHVFNLANNLEYGAFLSLAQHHGFPTPLLDWTYSPFVAAFFAFRHVPKRTSGNEVARIYIFDEGRWHLHWPRVNLLDVAYPHVTIIEPLAIENQRMIPQQAVTMITNLDDVEAYLNRKAVQAKTADDPYLRAIDIPWTSRGEVMRELRYMGITAGAMFPGLDGICEELGEQFFLED